MSREGGGGWRSPAHTTDGGEPPPARQNFWGRPVAAHGDKCDAAYTLLPPSKFLPFAVPGGEAAGGAPFEFELPTEYRAALQAHAERLQRFEAELSAMSCSAEMQAEVKSSLISSFKEWLQRTGNMRQLHDLMGQ